MMLRLFLVTLDVPKGATINDAKDFITAALLFEVVNIRHDPEEPMRFQDVDAIKVKRVQQGDVLR